MRKSVGNTSGCVCAAARPCGVRSDARSVDNIRVVFTSRVAIWFRLVGDARASRLHGLERALSAIRAPVDCVV